MSYYLFDLLIFPHVIKLDGVGPVDNRPSNKVAPKLKKKNYDMGHMTHDT